MTNIRSDGKPAHVWVTGESVGFDKRSQLFTQLLCKNCGVMKGNPKYPETPCKGRVHVTFRSPKL